MEPTDITNSKTSEVNSLSDLIVKYDLSKMLAEAKQEFESVVTSRELLTQKDIGNFFNLEVKKDARN